MKKLSCVISSRVIQWWLALALAGSMGCGFDFEPEMPQSGKSRGPMAVLFNVTGPLAQFPGATGLLSAKSNSQYRFEELLTKAVGDPQVQEIVIHVGALDISFARATELASAISKTAAGGKPITCHINTADNLVYYLVASACPKILLSPAGGVEAIGLSLEAVYVRELLASLGIVADMLHVGKYKDAAEPLMRDSMSPEAREAAEGILFELHEQYVSAISTGRKLTAEKVKAIIDAGPYGAADAHKLGLVDEVSSLGPFLELLRDKYPAGVVDNYGQAPPKAFSWTELLKMISPDDKKSEKPKHAHVALVRAIGPIVTGVNDDMFANMEMVYDAELVKVINEAAREPAVRAVVLRIDSPGGDALASDNIWQAVRHCASKKPVVASMGDVAASGGYYIASAATEVFASNTTLTGSIGVVGGKIVLGEAASKYGIRTERITTGKRAALASPFTAFNQEERAAITALMQRTYDLFVDRVVAGREMTREQVLAVASGRVWTGSQALSAGLVNSIGGLSDALTRARELAKLGPGAPVELLPEPKNIMEMLTESLSQSPESTALGMVGRYPTGRRAVALFSLILRNKAVTFAPILFDVR